MTGPPPDDIWQRLARLNHGDRDVAYLIRQLLEYRARSRDSEVNSRLLRKLVFQYAAVEKQLVRLNHDLVDKQRRLEEDLKAAAEIQFSLLPRTITGAGRLEVAWMFKPSGRIGGDIFNLVRLDEDHWGLYVLDVSGHGVPAAMVAVSVYQFLQLHMGVLLAPGTTAGALPAIRTPVEVFEALEGEFPFERFTNFFTIAYFVLNTRSGRLLYGTAGHPPPVILRAGGGLEKLDTGSPPIGLRSLRPAGGQTLPFREDITELAAGDKLLVYTDGILDYQDSGGRFFGGERLYALFGRLNAAAAAEAVAEVETALNDYGRGAELHDDITLLALRYRGPAPAGS